MWPASSEKSVRAGSSIANRGPSITRRPPWRSAVARTSARPRPEPRVPALLGPRQNRVLACSTLTPGIPVPASVTDTTTVVSSARASTSTGSPAGP